MATATINGATINYEMLGGSGPWVALMPGGRSGIEAVHPLGEQLAAAGYRVLLHDRRNCGASDVVIAGEDSEQEIWADDLHELLRQLGATPAYVGGGSAGCRVALLLAIRHPEDVSGLLLWWVTGGQVAADRLSQQYYTQFIELARQGGMAAVCATPFFAERIAANPGNRERLMSMPVDEFVAVMSRWRETFTQGADLPVIGATEVELRGIDVPICIVPGAEGWDATHPQAVGERLQTIVPDGEVHLLYTDKERDALPTPADQATQLERQRRLAEVFSDFLARHASVGASA
jgi:pimeloyl-ACP methyl ester carboxylesterase